MSVLKAGAAQTDITPIDSQFLFGYPHVERYSTGVHDPLLSSAVCLSTERETVLFVSNDIIFVDKTLVAHARRRIQELTGIPEANIMVTATHTHSGPITVNYLSNMNDPIVPRADPAYLRRLEDGIVESAARAAQELRPAEVGLALADATGIGTNRRDPNGPADLSTPVLSVRTKTDQRMIACMLVCSMHPTVLHEDSSLVSADFPGAARQYLQERVVGRDCPVVYHTGPEGNQSPRHVTKGNTFEEASRIGEILGRAVEGAIHTVDYTDDVELLVRREFCALAKKKFPQPAVAERRLAEARQRFEKLKLDGASKAEVRTAECDWFGAEETATLSRAFSGTEIEPYYKSCLPAEIQLIVIGPWTFVGWPGEVFIEHGLAVKERFSNTFIINLANGELQGYIVTKEAAEEGGYEASNAMFDYRAGSVLSETTSAVLQRLAQE